MGAGALDGWSWGRGHPTGARASAPARWLPRVLVVNLSYLVVCWGRSEEAVDVVCTLEWLVSFIIAWFCVLEDPSFISWVFFVRS